MIIDKSDTAESFSKYYLLFCIWIYSEFICLIQCFSPWLSIYFRITSIGAPSVVSRQKLWLQKYSFQSFWRICGNFFFKSLLLALLYAFINLLISVYACAMKRICTWSLSWFHSCNVILYFGDMYSNISFALSDKWSSNTFLRYFTTSTRW